MKAEPVGIGDVAFLIANVMMDCPAKTVVRELLQNAIEAAEGKRIEWGVFDWNGTPKLCLYNEGRGMTEEELRDRMNIASSGKELGFGKNFGQGAKMSAGKSSPYGLVYRSCHDGIVSQIWLQLADLPGGRKRLVMVPQFDEYQGEEAIVAQVTDDAVERGRAVDRDWTEAILLGRSAEDNTTTGDFLCSEKSTSKNWLMQAINQRYYAFPPGTVIRNATITTARQQPRNARGMRASLVDNACTERQEVVATQHPILGSMEIRYGKLSGAVPAERRGGPLHADGLPGGTHVCLVYKNEIYDFDPRWYSRSGAYGFPGVSEDYYVHILIPDEAPVRNNNHRTDIIRDDDGAEIVTCEKLCDLVRGGRPQWILDDIAARNENNDSGRIRERIRRMAERLQVNQPVDVVNDEPGNDTGVLPLLDRGDGRSGGGGSPSRSPNQSGRNSPRTLGKKQDRPSPSTLDVDFRDKTLCANWYEDHEGYAGEYEKSINKIWLSRDFCKYRQLKDWVDQTWPASDENGRAMAILNDEYCIHAATYGVGALSFRGDQNWTPDQWSEGLKRESLSAHMRDASGTIQKAVRQKVGKLLNTGIRNQPAEFAHAG